ncbi:DNA-3-methyladenine glycosylase [Haliangium ochraceum]|uniref:DNA-3-methyladenine glycosylase n=1 Tax=Haliangium ochraceum TaxID=80816 RepID=UPI001E3ED9D7|nr:DNA-3-methyladenine glycosylase [Haliangium ochraceum]
MSVSAPSSSASVNAARLPARFFRQPAPALARALLGKTLVHGARSGLIVETEAYLGPEDQASHARFGPTPRARVMFGPGGRAYVYLCYGIHQMFNVVSGEDGDAGAVLVRALEPGAGLAADPALTRGPGKLTRALGLERGHTGTDLCSDATLYIAEGRAIAGEHIAEGARIGVDFAGSWAQAPLRFWIVDHPSVSRSRRPRS